jgi:hypothetical protein
MAMRRSSVGRSRSTAGRLGRHPQAQPPDRVVVVLADPSDVDTQRNECIDARAEPAALRQANIGRQRADDKARRHTLGTWG